jgi:hypothetical protein
MSLIPRKRADVRQNPLKSKALYVSDPFDSLFPISSLCLFNLMLSNIVLVLSMYFHEVLIAAICFLSVLIAKPDILSV